MVEVKICDGKTECRVKGTIADISVDTVQILRAIIGGIGKESEEYADVFKKKLPEIIALAFLDHSEIDRLADAMRSYREEIEGDKKCNQCAFYEGVHNVQGHAPCSKLSIPGVLWNDTCDQFREAEEGLE